VRLKRTKRANTRLLLQRARCRKRKRASGPHKMPAAAGGGHEAVFIAGALSGLAEGVTIQPLEMLKTRFQINSGPRMRLLPAVREILAEGGVRQLYRGGLPEIAGLMPRAAAAMSTLELSRRWCLARGGGLLPGSGSGGGSSTAAAAVTLTPAAAYATGALSGVSEGLAFAPFQVVKVRLMAREHLGKYANTFDCLTKLLREEGPRALFIGLAPTLWRNCGEQPLFLCGAGVGGGGLKGGDSHGGKTRLTTKESLRDTSVERAQHQQSQNQLTFALSLPFSSQNKMISLERNLLW
jgi:hypothetical protein